MYNKTLQLQTLTQLIRIADWYSIRVKKMKKKFVHFQGSVVTFFRRGG